MLLVMAGTSALKTFPALSRDSLISMLSEGTLAMELLSCARRLCALMLGAGLRHHSLIDSGHLQNARFNTLLAQATIDLVRHGHARVHPSHRLRGGAICSAGVSFGGLGGYKGTAMVPEGGDFIFRQALSPQSAIARLPGGADGMLRVNSFDIKYREDGSTEQFLSDLSVYDSRGVERQRKTISVNDPLRYQACHSITHLCH